MNFKYDSDVILYIFELQIIPTEIECENCGLPNERQIHFEHPECISCSEKTTATHFYDSIDNKFYRYYNKYCINCDRNDYVENDFMNSTYTACMNCRIPLYKYYECNYCEFKNCEGILVTDKTNLENRPLCYDCFLLEFKDTDLGTLQDEIDVNIKEYLENIELTIQKYYKKTECEFKFIN